MDAEKALLRSLLEYDPTTGALKWCVSRRGHTRAGDVVSNRNSNGYIALKVAGKHYVAHRICWLLANGAWPTGDIDHINGNRVDNRLENLRDVTRAENIQNQRTAQRRNKSGLLGVKRNHGGWSARICALGKHYHLGTFDTPEKAHQAYLTAKRQLHKGSTL